MARMSLELSDGINDLRRYLENYTHEPRVLEPSDAEIYVQILRVLFQHARTLENRLSRLLWNEAAEADLKDAVAREVLAEVSRPQTNLVLFPAAPRPFWDGRSA